MSELKDMKVELDLDLTETKEYKALVTVMGKTEAKEFLKKSDKDLEDMIIANEIHTKEVNNSISSNSEYKKALAIKKDFDDAKRDRLKVTVATTKAAALILYTRKKKQETGI